MNTVIKQRINDKEAQFLLTQLRGELGFFMEYMWETVKQLMLWNISWETFEERYAYAKKWAEEFSQRIDDSYQRGDFGRIWIMDGGPNYAMNFEDDRSRCIKILENWWVILWD